MANLVVEPFPLALARLLYKVCSSHLALDKLKSNNSARKEGVEELGLNGRRSRVILVWYARVVRVAIAKRVEVWHVPHTPPVGKREQLAFLLHVHSHVIRRTRLRDVSQDGRRGLAEFPCRRRRKRRKRILLLFRHDVIWETTTKPCVVAMCTAFRVEAMVPLVSRFKHCNTLPAAMGV
jgi:hypothetical protein